MATIGTDPNGRRRILFVAGDGKRKTVRLGKVSQRQAEAFKVRLEVLVGQRITGTLDDETARWVAGLEDDAHAKLAAVGLVPTRNRSVTTLGAFLTDFFKSVEVKPSTVTTYDQTRRVLVEHFGEAATLVGIGPAEAEKWRQWQKGLGLADSTIARRVKSARQMFRVAVRWKLIGENPFADVKAGSMANKARQHFIDRDVARRVIDACPDAEWRLLFALSRYGGLRCPSEHLALTRADVDWDRGRMRVPSCKTEHLAGGDHRFIPLFPELVPYLQDALELADPGSVHVITRYRRANQNLRTQLLRIIARAGEEPWPKLWHNLRSSRQTELEEQFPTHVVCAWLGNSEIVARAHYLQVRDAHFEQANGRADGAAQNQAQQPHARPRMVLRRPTATHAKPPDFPVEARPCGSVQDPNMTPTGFEPVSRP